MEEPDTGGREPVDLRCAQQPGLLSLIISGEEEATRQDSDLGDGERLANGHVEDLVSPAKSPGTSYWSIAEGPDHPLLIPIAPGPSAGKPRVQRVSRQGHSRIPGRDHRRYYHEYWRSEYLMDFDPERQGMICMVCGSSLATLKLSTIKRHIRQKHPDSLLWSTADKEVIRSGWESHLSVGRGQGSYGSEAEASAQEEELLISSQPAAVSVADDATPQELSQQPPSPLPCPEEDEAPQLKEQESAAPLAQTLERYLNDSLHAWFRQEFLMKYEAEAGRLQCMVCGAQLPSLHLDHIKRHVLDTHPNSLVFSSEQKHCILQAWAQTHEESENSIISEPTTKESGEDPFSQEEKAVEGKSDLHTEEDGTLTQDTCLIGEDGEIGAPQQGPQPLCPQPVCPQPLRQPRKKRLRGGNPWRLRLDYLVAYGPQGKGTYCMVCSEILRETKVSSFRRHIQECHPETTTLSRQEREAMAAAWTKDYSNDDTQSQEEIIQGKADVLDPDGTNEYSSPDVLTVGKRVKKEEDARGGMGKAVASRHTHYPGKDQRRNYQARWRTEYLMDYDCHRHGLICIVCGATLATLKVSTIKRHIQQVHPHSFFYSADERQQALLSYDQSALHFSHSEDCFPQDHGLNDPAPAPDHFGT